MNENIVALEGLRRRIMIEVLAAFNLSPQSITGKLAAALLRPPAERFARLAFQVDEDVRQDGLPVACRRLLPRFVDGLSVRGAECLPADGPLLVASNHPGAYDVVALLACLPRRDVSVVVSDVAFLRALPHLDARLIYTVAGTHGRMAALRELIRRLERGEAALIFPTGLVDPDPAVLPGAHEKLAEWSSSLALALRRAPAARLSAAVVSGVLAPAALRSPLLRLQAEPWRRRKLAEVLQIIQQVAFGRRFHLRPRLSFAPPLTAAELAPAGDGLMDAITARAQRLLAAHLAPNDISPAYLL